MALRTITVTATYDDSVRPDFTRRFTDNQGYPVNVPDGAGGTIPNPQTRAQYLQLIADGFFRKWLAEVYKAEKDRVDLLSSTANNSIEFT